MDIVRNADGTLVVPVDPPRHHGGDDDGAPVSSDAADTVGEAGGMGDKALPHDSAPPPGEGGYDEALSDWDHQQNPDRPRLSRRSAAARKRSPWSRPGGLRRTSPSPRRAKRSRT